MHFVVRVLRRELAALNDKLARALAPRTPEPKRSIRPTVKPGEKEGDVLVSRTVVDMPMSQT